MTDPDDPVAQLLALGDLPPGLDSPFDVSNVTSLQGRVQPRLQSSGGRPTDPSWQITRLVPMRPATWDGLKALAERISTGQPRKVSPAQIAAVLLEEAVADMLDGAAPEAASGDFNSLTTDDYAALFAEIASNYGMEAELVGAGVAGYSASDDTVTYLGDALDVEVSLPDDVRARLGISSALLRFASMDTFLRIAVAPRPNGVVVAGLIDGEGEVVAQAAAAFDDATGELVARFTAVPRASYSVVLGFSPNR